MANAIEIGIARADITPAVGIPMVGFAGRGTFDARKRSVVRHGYGWFPGRGSKPY